MNNIVTEYTNICAICGKPIDCEHHLIFGNGLKPLAEEDGIKIPICNNCHTLAGGKNQLHENPVAERLSKMLGQAIWEQHYGSREDFRLRYGKSYL